MQTYTHAAIGGMIGAVVFPMDSHAQIMCVVGSVLPDVPYALGITLNIKILKEELGPIAHSSVIWLFLLATAYAIESRPFLVVISAVALLHIVVDVLVHKEAPGYAWPFTIKLQEYFGIWEYRILDAWQNPGLRKFLPKVPEIAVIVVVVTIWVAATIFFK